MNQETKYSQYALVREMMETPSILRNFKISGTEKAAEAIRNIGRLFLTGEGSSRIFPAKNAMTQAMRAGLPINIATDGGRQALEYKLDSYVVFGASNSGQTKEVIAVFDKLKQAETQDAKHRREQGTKPGGTGGIFERPRRGGIRARRVTARVDRLAEL